MQPFRQPGTRDEPPNSVDVVELALKKQLARRRTTMRILVALGLLVVVAPFGLMVRNCLAERAYEREIQDSLKLTSDEKKELDALLAKADAAIAAHDAAFRKATSAEVLAALHQMEGSTCSEAPTAPDFRAAKSYVQYASVDTNYFGKGETPDAANPARGERSTLAYVRGRVASKEAQKSDLSSVRDVVQGGRRSRTIFVVVDAKTKPIVANQPSGLTYTAGTLRGHAYLYDAHMERVVCAGAIDVENSDEVDIQYSVATYRGVPLQNDYQKTQAAEASLERDLEVQVRQALAKDLESVR